jgi:hypothetical protein
MSFIPYADPKVAATTVPGQARSIVPFTNDAAGYSAAANEPSGQYQAAVAAYGPTSGNYTGNDSGGGGSPPPAPDPFAAWGGKAAYDSLVSGFNTQHTNINNTSTDAANTSARQINGSILDLLDSVRSGQGKINEASIQNELAKKQGFGSIMDMISHGIQSAGVTLANKNASDSSAAGAIARAYGDIGRRQNNKVNNQYELGNHNIGLQQARPGTAKSPGPTPYPRIRKQLHRQYRSRCPQQTSRSGRRDCRSQPPATHRHRAGKEQHQELRIWNSKFP